MVETLKLIPSAFFDVFARLIPGAAFLLALTAIWDTSWQQLVEILFGSTIADNVAASLTIFVAGGLAIGYLLSGPAKVIQRFGEKVDKRWVPIYVEFDAYVTELGNLRSSTSSEELQQVEKRAASAAPSDSPTNPPTREDVLKAARRNLAPNRLRVRYWRWRLIQLKEDSEPNKSLKKKQPELALIRELDKLDLRLDKLEGRSDEFEKRRSNERDTKTGYDYLRTFHPDLGAQCAKIRAEFTMHNALSGAALISAFAYSVNRVQNMSDNAEWSPWIFTLLLSVSIMEALRGWSTNVTQKSTVDKFMKIRSEPPRTWGAAGTEPPPEARRAPKDAPH